MNPTNKRSFIHKANKNREEESDIPDKFRVIKYLKKYFDMPCITGEALIIPGKNRARYPDISVKNWDPYLAILLHGGIHGDGYISTEYDDRARADYDLLPHVKLIEIYSAQTNHYDETAVANLILSIGMS